MDGFDLGRLTDRDFEDVCRDLFGDVLGVPLEVFPRGRDGGIDLRHVDGAGATTIVQCKHWYRSGTPKLLRTLRSDEVPKVRRLKPDRYLLAATVGLSPGEKDKIVDDFAPYIAGPRDVYGIDDLIAALRDRPRIVRSHFRLWLSSTTVLETLLNRAGHLRSDWLREEIARAAETFVPHAGFERARGILDARGVCVVTGPPGVGKTTTAMMLAAWLMGNGYDLHEVDRDVDEVLDLWRDDEPQAFLYDDFLGRTMLEPPFRKKEDRRLVSLVRRIGNTPGKALIMTSRDHILGEARRRSDQLSGRDVDLATSSIELDDLDPAVRGQILYNYVYGSPIASAQKTRFADPVVWRPIVTHRQFNPRVIEESLRLADADSADVAADLLKNLNDPLRIWEPIVENELPAEAVHLLEVLFVDGESSVDDVTAHWGAYRDHLRMDRDGRLARRALRMLDGSLIRIDRQHVEFHNPSIEDYFRHHVDAGRVDHLDALIATVTDPGQAYRLVAAAGDQSLRNHRTAVEEMIFEVRDAVTDSFSAEDDSMADHLDWVLSVAERLESPRLTRYVMEQSDELLVWGEHNEHLARLSNAMASSPLIPEAFAVAFRDRVGRAIADTVDEIIDHEEALGAVQAYGVLNELYGYSDETDVLPRLNALVAQRLDEIVAEDAGGTASPQVVAEIEELLLFVNHGLALDIDTAAAEEIVERSGEPRPQPQYPHSSTTKSGYNDVAAIMSRLDEA